MSFAASSKTRVAYVAETAWGTIPTTPTFLEIRRTNGNLRTKKTTVVSDEIHLDRNIRAEQQTGQDVTGSYDFEFSYGSFDDMFAGAIMGTWSTNVLKNGTTEQSFTFEETVDWGSSKGYARFTGCEVDSIDLTFASRQLVKGSIALLGQSETLDTAILTGATYTAPNTNPIETAASFASLTLASEVPTPIIKSLALKISNGLRVRDQVGSLYSAQFGVDQCEITGSFDAYFSSNALAADILAHTVAQLQWTVGAVSTKKYTFNIPQCQLLDGARKIGGRKDDVMYSVPFRGVFDPTTGASLVITRAVA